MPKPLPWILAALFAVAFAGLLAVHLALRTDSAHAVEVLQTEVERERAAREEAARLLRAREAELAELRATEGQAGGVEAPGTLEEEAAAWAARFGEDLSWRHGLATARAMIAGVDAERLVPMVATLWPRLATEEKQEILKAVALEAGHPAALELLHLGATDEELAVQTWAFEYLRRYAFRDFAESYDDYLEWWRRWKDEPLERVLAENARRLVYDLLLLQPSEFDARLAGVEPLDLEVGERAGVDLERVFADAGAFAVVDGWLATGDPWAAQRAFRWATELDADEAWLRAHALPLVHGADLELAGAAAEALGAGGADWAVADLVQFLERHVLVPEGEVPAAVGAAATALAEIGDPTVVPALIGLVAARPEPEILYGIGHHGLGGLTGVSFDESHDGAWWLDWWERNRSRFPAGVRAMSIPAYGSQR